MHRWPASSLGHRSEVVDNSADVFPGKFNPIGVRELEAVFILSQMVVALYQEFWASGGSSHLRARTQSVSMFKEETGKN